MDENNVLIVEMNFKDRRDLEMKGPYEEGYEAFHRGEMPEMNPYDKRDAQHDEWSDGYIHADCQESGEFEPK